MKILFIDTVPLFCNGITTFVTNNLLALSEMGNKCDLVAIEPIESSLFSLLKSHGIDVINLKQRNKNLISYYFKLVKIIKNGEYDVVHTNGNSCTMAVECFAAKIAGCKVRIAHSHNTTCDHKFIHKILRPLFELTCNYRFACGKEAGEWLFKKKKFEIINNGIDTKKYSFNIDKRNQIRDELKIKDTEILLGHVGVFNFQKNQEFLIELIGYLDEKFKLLLIGDGENFENIKNIVTQKKLINRVIFTGSVDNVQDYLQAIDCFVFPSRFEGFGIVMIEAQAAGLPCVASEFVPEETAIISNITFLPLDSELWKDKVQSMDFARESNADVLIKNSGYDISQNALLLLKLYIGYIKNIGSNRLWRNK